MNYKSITDKPNRINNLSKEDKILEIKQFIQGISKSKFSSN